MSTRSRIAIQKNEGIVSVYCHWDGYPENNGAILNEHYLDPAKINELLSHGSISTLGSSAAATIFYGRDRGETGIEPEIAADEKGLLAMAGRCGEEYLYLFRDDTWHVASRGDGSPSGKWRKLSTVLKKVAVSK